MGGRSGWLVVGLGLALLSVAPRATGRTWYVATAHAGDGSSWAQALDDLPSALAGAREGDEIWVAAGTYLPTAGTDREASFALAKGVAVYGGFVEHETRREQRDWTRHETILSGDIGDPNHPDDNVYHVVTGADGAILDGFTITGGNALTGLPRPRPMAPPGRGGPGRPVHTSPEAILSGPQPGVGAGMVNYQCAPTVAHCTFTGNRATKAGAVYNMTTTSFPPRPSGPRSPTPRFVECRFADNYALVRGGAASNDLGTSPTFLGCVFEHNLCDDKGGAIYDDFACSPVIVNALFVGNRAYQGGAMANDGSSCPTLLYSTFVDNHAVDLGPALYQGTGPANNPTVDQCVLWGNLCETGPNGIYDWHDCEPRVTGSLVEGGYPGEGNLAEAPRFADAAQGDYRLAAGSPGYGCGYGADGAAEAMARPPQPAPMAGPPGRPERGETRPGLSPRSGGPIHVRAGNQAGPWDGRTWATAFATLQAGIDRAAETGDEVWVAAGTYLPAADQGREAAFHTRAGGAIYGGFAGTEIAREQRDPAQHPTILSGDIGAAGDAADNCYHVVVGADGARLDGLTITAGNADGRTWNAKGGGLIAYPEGAQGPPRGPAVGWSMSIVDCTFVANRAVEGGAVYHYDRSSPRFERCTFEGNEADFGGALLDRVGVASTLLDCTFSHNRATWRGGAILLDYGSRATLSGCRFDANTSGGHGGAIYTVTRASQLEHTTAELRDCTFSGNRAELRGGAIANFDKSLLTAIHCAFTANHAGTGGGALSDDRAAQDDLTDCTFDGNSSEEGAADIARETAAAGP